MTENFIEAQYDITKRSRLKKFYDSNKILIFSSILIIIISLASFIFYLKNAEKNKILLSENYVKARIYLEDGNKSEAINMLKEVIYANDSIYSTLSLFLIINQNLIEDYAELSTLFDHLLENNRFEVEIKNLLIYKKALFNSNYITETELLEDIKPLLNDETLWRPHALLLLGDYFVSKREKQKAKDFYSQILKLEINNNNIYNQTLIRIQKNYGE